MARPASRTTRTQRVMVSLVRRKSAIYHVISRTLHYTQSMQSGSGWSLISGFAALPNLPGSDPDHQPMGPLPAAVGMAFMEEAEEENKKAEKEKAVRNYKPYVSKRRATQQPLQDSTSPMPPPSRQSSTSSESSSVVHFGTKEALTTAHDNLHTRLAPFWSSILPNRRVLFDVHAIPPDSDHSDLTDTAANESPETRPVHSFQLITDGNGHFSKTIVIPWEKLCSSPSTVAAAFDTKSSSGALLGWNLRIRSRLDYEDLPPAESDRSYRERLRRAVSAYGVDAVDAPPSTSRSTQPGADEVVLNSPKEPQVVQWTSIKVGRADGVHIISDLVSPPLPPPPLLLHQSAGSHADKQDDTVKHSDILSGPREVFR